MMGRKSRIQEHDELRISRTLWFIYCGFLIASAIILGRIFFLQNIWEPDPEYVDYFRPKKEKKIIEPERGAILDCNEKILALSTPLYNIYMDCIIRKDSFEKESPRKRDSLENKWRSDLRAMCNRLPEVIGGNKTADDYYNTIISYRDSKKKGRRNVLIATGIDHATWSKIRKLPLAREGRYKSGLKEKKILTRKYPYGNLAGRIIGDVTIDADDPGRNRFVGIEGEYDYILHGKEGVQWMKKTDNGSIADKDSTDTKVENGQDIRTTIDIDIQDIADRALRRYITEEEDIEGGCVVVLDVRTGAVRAMVNLLRNSKGQLGENFNMAIGRAGEPGSIFKAATLMTVLEDRHASLDTKLPTNHGKLTELSSIKETDRYIADWERKHNTSTISVQDGFKISSNYVFRKLALNSYGTDPGQFVNRLYEYHLHDAYEFDLHEKGGTKPHITAPESKFWSKTALVSAAIGYSVMETPLNMVAFYNAIANNGKMMKPYIIEAYESAGSTTKEFGPQILNGSICSKSTADSLTKALTMVTLEGTARKLKNARCTVAGKTGTARVAFEPKDRASRKDAYIDKDGNRKYQATFVGFFPAEEPVYTAIVTLYTKPTKHSVYGGNLPALTFGELVDNIWAMDTRWSGELKDRTDLPKMKARYISTGRNSAANVPDLKGLGLKDALYAIENNGYRCSYEGVGHVASQSPAAGSRYEKGQTVKIVLK